EWSRALTRFVGQVGVAGPAAIEMIVEAHALLVAIDLQHALRRGGRGSGDSGDAASSGREAVYERQVMAAYAVPDRACIRADDIRRGPREGFEPVGAGAADRALEVVVVLAEVAAADVD